MNQDLQYEQFLHHHDRLCTIKNFLKIIYLLHQLLVVPNKDKLLRSGMFAHVRLYLGGKSTLVVNRDALNKLPGTGNYYVYVVQKDKAVLKNVETGFTQGNYVEVTNGLTEGEKVVVKGQNRLKDGVPVVVVNRVTGGAS